MKKYLKFLAVSYVVAILFEMNANFFFDGALFQQPNWVIGFFIWYGFFYSVMFFIFRNRRLSLTIITGAILGTLAEYFLFHRIHLIADPIIYAIMFWIPFKVYHKYIKK